jgi:hypothetical protein
MWVFATDRRHPRVPSHVARRAWASIASCFVGHKTARSSAYRTKAYRPRRTPLGVHEIPRACSMPCSATFNKKGLMTPIKLTMPKIGLDILSASHFTSGFRRCPH